jgi:hypothetical protein
MPTVIDFIPALARFIRSNSNTTDKKTALLVTKAKSVYVHQWAKTLRLHDTRRLTYDRSVRNTGSDPAPGPDSSSGSAEELSKK